MFIDTNVLVKSRIPARLTTTRLGRAWSVLFETLNR